MSLKTFCGVSLSIVSLFLQLEWKQDRDYVTIIIDSILRPKKFYKDNINGSPSINRTTLVRKSNIHRHHLINEICLEHESDSKKTSKNQMMQTTNRFNYWYDPKGYRRSICFRVNNPFQTVIGLRFLCNKGCDTTGYLPNLTKRGHDLILVITLEKHGMIMGRRSVEVCPTDLIK